MKTIKKRPTTYKQTSNKQEITFSRNKVSFGIYERALHKHETTFDECKRTLDKNKKSASETTVFIYGYGLLNQTI